MTPRTGLPSGGLTDHGPRDDAAKTSGNQHSEGVGMGVVTTKCRQQLLAAFISHEVDASSNAIPH